jgi:hypothetical protein
MDAHARQRPTVVDGPNNGLQTGQPGQGQYAEECIVLNELQMDDIGMTKIRLP